MKRGLGQTYSLFRMLTLIQSSWHNSLFVDSASLAAIALLDQYPQVIRSGYNFFSCSVALAVHSILRNATRYIAPLLFGADWNVWFVFSRYSCISFSSNSGVILVGLRASAVLYPMPSASVRAWVRGTEVFRGLGGYLQRFLNVLDGYIIISWS